MDILQIMAVVIAFGMGDHTSDKIKTMISTAPGDTCQQLAAGVKFKIRSTSTGNSMFVDTADWGIECPERSDL